MASRWAIGGVGGTIVGVVVVIGMVVACGPAAPSERPPGLATPDGAAPATSPGPPATPRSTSGGPSPTVAGRDGPPDALLAAEGGDPVAGQLGTYAWLDTGSDAPWLPGAPVAVGAGEPLAVSLVPDGEVRAWAARYVPANAVGPDGATSLGEGAGDPAFAAPGPGSWTVEVFIEFAPSVGDARYFWRLEVE